MAKKTKAIFRKTLSLVLALVMALSVMSLTAFAAGKQLDKQLDAGTIEKAVGENGFYQRLPRMFKQHGHCGTIVTVYAPDYYYGCVANGENGIITGDFCVGRYKQHISDEGVGLDYFDWDCLEYDYVAARPGIANVSLDYSYYYSWDPDYDCCGGCGRYFSYPSGELDAYSITTMTVKVYANYMLNFDANDGEGAPNSVAAKKVFDDEWSATIPQTEPTKDGATFLGWSENPQATQADYKPGEPYTACWQESDDANVQRILYAVWDDADSETYTVTYTDGVEDEDVFVDQTYEVKKGDTTPAFNFDGGTAEVDEAGKPTREGYKFEGWAPTVAETVTGNAIYEATWSKVHSGLTLTYDANDGSNRKEVVDVDPQTEKVSLADGGLMFPRGGYTFKGWRSYPGEGNSGHVEWNTGEVHAIKKNEVLYAVWEKNPEPQLPELSVVKTLISNVSGLKVGDDLIWKIEIKGVDTEGTDNLYVTDQGVTLYYDEDCTQPLPSDDNGSYYVGEITSAPVTVYAKRAVTEDDLGKTIENEASVRQGDRSASGSVTSGQLPAAAPKLEVTKTVTSTPANGTAYAAGETITYTVTVKNTGNVDLTDVTVEDTFSVDSSKLTWSPSNPTTQSFNLAAGASQTFTATYTVQEADLGKDLTNTATASGKDGNNDVNSTSDQGSNSTTTPTEARSPKLDVSKTIKDQKDFYQPGDVIEYTITVKNTGNVTVTGITLSDEFGGRDLTWSGDTIPFDLAPNASKTFTATYTVQTSDVGTLTNTATASGVDGNEPVTGSSNSVKAEVYPTAPASIDGTVTVKCVNTAANIGHADQTYDLDPNSVTIGAVQKAADGTYTVTATVKAQPYVDEYNKLHSGHSTPTDGDATKIVTLTYTENGWTPETTTVEFDVTCDAKAIPDLTVTKVRSASSTSSNVGDTIEWTISIINNTDEDKTVTVTDYINGNPVTLNGDTDGEIQVTVSAHETVEVQASYTIQEDDAGTTIQNAATVNNPNDSSDPNNGPKNYTAEENSSTTVPYVVTFDPNEGNWDGSTDALTQNVSPNTAIDPDNMPADPTRDGYTFDGWVTESGASFDPNGPITENTVVQAQWTRNRHTVTVNYVDEAGNTIRPATTTRFNEGVRYNVPVPEIEGYTFDHAVGALNGTVNRNITVTLVYNTDEPDEPDVPGPDVPGPDEPGPDVPGPDEPGPEEPPIDIPDPDVPQTGEPDEPGGGGTVTPGPDEPGPVEPGPDEPGPDEPPIDIPDEPDPPLAGTFTVTVQYVDENGNTIASDLVEEWPEGSMYFVDVPDIDGYTFDHTDDELAFVVTGDTTVTLVYAEDAEVYTVTVNYVDSFGRTIRPSTVTSYELGDVYIVTIPGIPGYTYTYAIGTLAGTVTGNIVVTLVYNQYVVPTYPEYPTNPNPSVDIPDTDVPQTDLPTLPNDDGDITIEDEDVPLAGAEGLNTREHVNYIIGTPEGKVLPTNPITRAEAATIFFRLMTDEFRVANWSTVNSFSDVKSGSWYSNAVSTCANAGKLLGTPAGTFEPNRAITRAEFATIAVRFMMDGYNDDVEAQDFPDTVGHWAAKDIRRAVQAGWITGLPDGTFHPNDPITRAEAVTIINRMLGRVPHEAGLMTGMRTFSDNMDPNAWYYLAIQEAANYHDYERDVTGITEDWTMMDENIDWNKLEDEWVANGGYAPRG